MTPLPSAHVSGTDRIHSVREYSVAVAGPRFDDVFLLYFAIAQCSISIVQRLRKDCEPGPGIVMGALTGNRSHTKPCPLYAE